MGITGLTQCWQTCSALRWQLGARRGTLLVPVTALNTSVSSPESQAKRLGWSVNCAHEFLETSQTGTCWGLQRAQLPSPNCSGGVRSSWKSCRTLMGIFSHPKNSKLMPHRGKFSAEIEQVGNPCLSQAWACLALLLATRKPLIPKEANGKGERDFSPATGV